MLPANKTRNKFQAARVNFCTALKFWLDIFLAHDYRIGKYWRPRDRRHFDVSTDRDSYTLLRRAMPIRPNNPEPNSHAAAGTGIACGLR